MSIFSNGAMHYLIVMYSVSKKIFSLGSLFNTKLIYNEQEEVFAYLFVGIIFSFVAGVYQYFDVLIQAKTGLF